MLFGRRKKNPIILRDKGVVEWKYATCGYCSTGCSMEVGLDAAGKAVTTRGAAVASGAMDQAWQASSAAAGALMLLTRAKQELETALAPPGSR